MRGGSPGLIALTVFFGLGALFAGAASAALAFPGTALDSMWRLNLSAHTSLRSMGQSAPLLMLAVSGACALTSLGLAFRAGWGHRAALALLVINMIGDIANALARGDVRTLVGIPIAAALIVYLSTPTIRSQFSPSAGLPRSSAKR
jgi:hypothetical protein